MLICVNVKRSTFTLMLSGCWFARRKYQLLGYRLLLLVHQSTVPKIWHPMHHHYVILTVYEGIEIIYLHDAKSTNNMVCNNSPKTQFAIEDKYCFAFVNKHLRKSHIYGKEINRSLYAHHILYYLQNLKPQYWVDRQNFTVSQGLMESIETLKYWILLEINFKHSYL